MVKIDIRNLCAEYTDKKGTFLALKDVSFDVKNGEFVSVIGSSGCGKSTLLGVLQGLKFPSAGEAAIDGKPITGPGADRSVVFQNYSLFPWMSARSNISFAVKQVRKGLTRAQRNEIAQRYLSKVGLSDFGQKYPSQLSGGMQQRVAIARALAMDTDILLMDEPFGAIDAKNRSGMQELLLSLWEGDDTREKKTVVFVTHDIDEAIFLSDRIVMLSNSPGSVYKIMEIPFGRPRNHPQIIKTDAYHKLRDELFSLFYHNVGENIGGNEVVI
ncbi:MAG: ABC transporter ATP-binding protein [Oscillospiraceae bacterium]|nr:ABC transporter ATP-binding protein [Oscillospiraceae bacterium]